MHFIKLAKSYIKPELENESYDLITLVNINRQFLYKISEVYLKIIMINLGYHMNAKILPDQKITTIHNG